MTRRDVVAGLLVAGAVLVWLVGGVLGVLLTVRGTAVGVTALGLGAALVGGWWRRPVRDPLLVGRLAAVGLLAAVAAGTTLVTGSPDALLALVLVTAMLWLLATVRHISSRQG